MKSNKEAGKSLLEKVLPKDIKFFNLDITKCGNQADIISSLKDELKNIRQLPRKYLLTVLNPSKIDTSKLLLTPENTTYAFTETTMVGSEVLDNIGNYIEDCVENGQTIIAIYDLNLCEQVKDSLGIPMENMYQRKDPSKEGSPQKL